MDESRNNLPHPLTSFVGREAELSALCALIGPQGEWRLATVTGAGGIGKTRVALEVARRLRPRLRHGVRLLEIAPIARADAIPLELLAALGLARRPGEEPEQTAIRFLEERQILLLLDNCEHLLEGAAHLVERLLTACPQVYVLATSRRPLGMIGELRWQLQPLRTPGRSTPSVQSPDAALEFEAVRLFTERARAARPSFTLSPENVGAVTAICRRLDGMPLAIELVAPLVNSFTLHELAAQLDQRLHMQMTSHTIHARQRTLHATAAWSYQLLMPAEQALFRQLAVFAEGWSAAAAEAICTPLRPDEASTAALLARLADCSLVAVEEHGNEMRYRLLATLQDYAQDRLQAAGEAGAVAERHARHYSRFAAEAAAGLRTREAPAWALRLDAEFDNLGAASAWLLEHDVAAAAALGADLLWYCVWRRRFAEGCALLEGPLADPRSAESPREHLRAASALSVLLMWQVEVQGALEWARRGLEMIERGGLRDEDDPAVVRARLAHAFAATAARASGDHARAAQEAAARLRAGGDAWQLGWALICLAAAHWAQGDMEGCTRACRQSVAAYRSSGDPFGLSIGLYGLGVGLLVAGDYRDAAAAFAECNALSLRLDNRSLFVLGQFRLAETLQALGEGRQALNAFHEALARLREAGGRPSGDHLIKVAGMAADAGLWETAAQIIGAIQSDPTPVSGLSAPVYERTVERTRRQLVGSEFARLEMTGAALSVEDALALGLRRLEEAMAGSAAQQLPAIAVAVLGPVQVSVDGVPLAVTKWVYRKARELLLLLACFGPRTRGQIGLALWPDASPAQLRNNLGVAVYHLRRALGHQETVLFDGERYTVNPALDWWVDLAELRRLLAEVGRQGRAPAGETAIRALEEAAALVRGELLEDQSEGEWFDGLREEVRLLHLDILLRLGEEYAAANRSQESVAVLQRALAVEPLHEEAHRAIMACYLAQGQAGRAIAHYRRLAEQMRAELGVEPDAATQALYEQARRMAGAE